VWSVSVSVLANVMLVVLLVGAVRALVGMLLG